MPELHAANDLNNMVPSPLSELPAAKPPPSEIVKCVPVGAESDTNSSVMDSGDEWDKTETVGPSRSSTPTYKNRPHLGGGPCCCSGRRNGEESGPIVGRHHKYNPRRGGRKLGCMVDSQSARAEDQFDDVIIEEEVVIQTVMEGEELDHAEAGELLTQRGKADEDDVD